jgi:undecaprenyl-diphosphatase
LNDYLLAVLLGIVEGLTEFLPVSSTAHLRILQALLGVDLSDGYWKMFAVVIQLGAILSLPIYFRARILNFLRTFPKGAAGDRSALTHPLSLVLLAFVVTAIPTFLLTRVIGENLENLRVMALALILGGVIMWAVDAWYASPRFRLRTDDIERITPWQAVWIGACQVFSAVFPGTSRSMATIAAGQLAGMSRTAALEFSFFVSMPTMTAATLYDLVKSVGLFGMPEENPIGATGIDAHGWVVLAIGFFVSFVVAYGVVAWFMHWVRRRGFAIFAVYRIALGTAILVWVAGM